MRRLISFISPSSIFVTFAISTLLSVFIVKVSSITLSFIFFVFSPKQITFGSFCEQQTAYLLWAMTLSKTHFCLVSKISASSLLNSISQLTEVRQPPLSLAGSNLQCLLAIFKIVSLSMFFPFFNMLFALSSASYKQLSTLFYWVALALFRAFVQASFFLLNSSSSTFYRPHNLL